MEEEAGQIISKTVSPSDRVSDVFQRYFGHKNGIDLDPSIQRKTHRQ